jgi:hypothetical protein
MSILSSNNSKRWLIYGGLLLPYLILPFSPLVSFVISIIFVFKSNGKKIRYASYPALTLSFSLIAVSRNLFISFKDDYQTYFDNYITLLNGIGYERFGIELGWSGLNTLLGSIFGEIPPRALLFIYVLIQFLLVIYFIELFISRFKLKKNANELVAIFIALLPILAFSVTIRHNIALLIIGSSIVYKNIISKYLGVVIASTFHLSALPIYFIHISISRVTKKTWSFLFLLSIVAALFILGGSKYFEEMPKIRAFVAYELTFEPLAFLKYYKLIFLAFTLCFFLKNEKTELLKKYIFLVLTLALILDWILPYISFRVFQLQIMFSGLVLFLIFCQFKKNLNNLVIYQMSFIGLLLLKVVLLLTDKSDFALFKSFPWGALTPFYYLDEIFEIIYERNRTY